MTVRIRSSGGLVLCLASLCIASPALAISPWDWEQGAWERLDDVIGQDEALTDADISDIIDLLFKYGDVEDFAHITPDQLRQVREVVERERIYPPADSPFWTMQQEALAEETHLNAGLPPAVIDVSVDDPSMDLAICQWVLGLLCGSRIYRARQVRSR
ncbi:MAG: hypothetical protein HYZ08_01115 [Candidatus Kerfeldbacteria bacterium]|nr:hypothetical protein [Candidatus Kerfeldbacteria bacterium]